MLAIFNIELGYNFPAFLVFFIDFLYNIKNAKEDYFTQYSGLIPIW